MLDVEGMIRRLAACTEENRAQFRRGFADFARLHDLVDWEGWFSPYDEETYSTVLSHVAPDDVVLEIGAGDLRLALRMAERARKVYAVEVNPLVVGSALEIIGLHLPRNLYVVCANALDFPVPPQVTSAIADQRSLEERGRDGGSDCSPPPFRTSARGMVRLSLWGGGLRGPGRAPRRPCRRSE
jgi:SAM-dependent methyltransferase